MGAFPKSPFVSSEVETRSAAPLDFARDERWFS
jgi:hypothetical protein